MLSQDNELIALIAEGSAENAILTVLMEHDGLKYKKENIFQGEIIRCRNGKEFARRFLNKSINKKVKVYRILDSRNERFRLPLAYKSKVSEVINLYTRPEIEILHIINNDDYQRYKKQAHIKPSIYAKEHYKDLQNIKSYNENYEFWDRNYNRLIRSLKLYKKYSNNKEQCIADILSN